MLSALGVHFLLAPQKSSALSVAPKYPASVAQVLPTLLCDSGVPNTAPQQGKSQQPFPGVLSFDKTTAPGAFNIKLGAERVQTPPSCLTVRHGGGNGSCATNGLGT